jgi:hypothetical protein
VDNGDCPGQRENGFDILRGKGRFRRVRGLYAISVNINGPLQYKRPRQVFWWISISSYQRLEVSTVYSMKTTWPVAVCAVAMLFDRVIKRSLPPAYHLVNEQKRRSDNLVI